MKDRVSTYPGRVQLTPVSGQANVYNLVRADQPTEPGTPLNKASLLTDAVAALLGGNSTMTPNEAFNVLAENFYAYTWRRYDKKYKAAYSANSLGTKVYNDSIGLGPTNSSYGTLSTMLISKNISIDSNGNASLVSPTQYTVSKSNQNTINNNIANRYFQMKTLGSSNYISSGLNTADIYFNENTSGTIEIQSNTVLLRTKDSVKVVSTETDIEYSTETIVKSTNSSAYPNPSGLSGDYYYEYIGRLIDRVYESRPIAVVKYIGTGTYGSANPVEVTFPFAPRYVMIHGYRSGTQSPSVIYTNLFNSGSSVVYNHPLDTGLLTTSYQAQLAPSMMSDYPTYSYGKKSADGRTISWYCTQTQNSSSYPGKYQRNEKGLEYICIGIG